MGYLDDGTMIVVEGGRDYVNQNVRIVVTSVLQTSAGRMIFGKFESFASQDSAGDSRGDGGRRPGFRRPRFRRHRGLVLLAMLAVLALAGPIGCGKRGTLEPPPARRTLDIVSEGKRDLDVLRSVAEQQQVSGAFVRVRWVVADEDRHEVDRAAIQRLLAGAAEVKLEGRTVPVARSRAQGKKIGWRDGVRAIQVLLKYRFSK